VTPMGPASWAVLLSEALTMAQVTALMAAILGPTGLFFLVVGIRRGDRTLAYYGGYMTLLLGAFAVQLGFQTGTGSTGWRSWLGNFIQLPYAWCYLRFVRHYFELGGEGRLAGWARAYRVLEWAYLVPLALLAVPLLRAVSPTSWIILALNLSNLLGSFLLGCWALTRREPGAGRFVAANVPLTLSGVLHALQWALQPEGLPINGILPFWLGVILQLGLFGVVLMIRWQQTGRSRREVLAHA